MVYLLDANVFIEAENSYYMSEFCPAFWDWLVRENQRGIVYSIQHVGDELQKGNDKLAYWAKQQGNEFFLPIDSSIHAALVQVSSWASGGSYTASAISEFLAAADYYLVACAYAKKYTVVTREVKANSEKRIKIPDACGGLKVSCVSPYEMLKNEKARFVLGS